MPAPDHTPVPPDRTATGRAATAGTSDTVDPPRYAEAVAELEQILAELEGSEVDVDRLADRVARAAGLIAVCRERIASARAQIDEVLVDLDEAGSPEQGDASRASPA